MASISPKNVLIDTHVLFWIILDPKRLGTECLSLIKNADTVYVSMVSLIEAAMKARADKLPFTMKQLLDEVEDSGFQLLDVTTDHITFFGTVDLPHKDPFDALLVTQAMADSFVFVTADQAILASDYKLLVDARL